MLENLLQHNNLGTPSQITYIINLLMKGDYPILDLKKACASKEYRFSSSFDGIISLLEWLKIIKVSNVVSLYQKINTERFTVSICNLLFKKLSQENQLHVFLNSKNLSFETNIYIKNSFIELRYSPIRNFLIDLGLFEKDSLMYNQFIINKEFSVWFFSNIAPLINDSKIKNNSLEKLKNKQAIQEELGAEAEKIVLHYERTIRKEHLQYTNIKIISEIDTKAGYDIQSYKNDSSFLIDKFIEVKSYSENPYFYWSKNEIEVAKQEQDNYFLYLVNRDEINDLDYQPTIIQNPYKHFLNNQDWHKDCQNWQFNKINQ